MSFKLVHPSINHKKQFEEMMDEWEAFGGRINPGAIRRYSHQQGEPVSYEKWLSWVENDKKIQELFFFMDDEKILGAISIRLYKDIGLEGHSGYGIRPSEREKGYAVQMLSIALPFMRNYGFCPIIITCDKNNIGSAKTILHNGGVLKGEEIDVETGETVQIYHLL